MRIALPTIWFHRGQTEVTKTFKKVFEELGHEVFIHARMGGIGNQPKLEFRRRGWHDENIWYYNYYDLKKAEFLEKIKQQKIDLVFFNEEYDWELVKMVKKIGIKVASYLDYLHKDWLKKPSPLEIYDLILCSTRRAFNMVENLCLAKWIGWGMKEENKVISVKKPYVFFENVGWGGINDRKGINTLLSVYKLFLKKHPEAFGSLLIHCQMYFNPDEGNANKEDFDGVDVICGSMNLPGLYHMGEVYCYPAKLDGLGLSLLEAINNGLAIICPDYPPWNEFVEDQYNGILVPIVEEREREDGIAFREVFVDTQKFLEAMEELYLDKEKRSLFRSNSLYYSTRVLNWRLFKDKIVEALVSIR